MQTKTDKVENVDKYKDLIIAMYNGINNIKKALLDTERVISPGFKEIGLDFENGHLYLVSRTSCKSSRSPY